MKGFSCFLKGGDNTSPWVPCGKKEPWLSWNSWKTGIFLPSCPQEFVPLINVFIYSLYILITVPTSSAITPTHTNPPPHCLLPFSSEEKTPLGTTLPPPPEHQVAGLRTSCPTEAQRASSVMGTTSVSAGACVHSMYLRRPRQPCLFPPRDLQPCVWDRVMYLHQVS